MHMTRNAVNGLSIRSPSPDSSACSACSAANRSPCVQSLKKRYDAYNNSRTMAVPRDRTRTLLSTFLEWPTDAENVAGRTREAAAIVIRDDIVEVTVELNACSLRFIPPITKEHPRTSKVSVKL